MAFFNEIDRKLTQLGQGAIQKTKEVSDISKISGTIKNLENRKRDCYIELGEYFYTRYQGVPDEQDNVLIQKLKDINNEITRCQKQISKLKGVIQCSNCNAEISADSLFCSVCGSKVENTLKEQEYELKLICKQCGKELKEGQKFCTNCGAKAEDKMEVNVEE